MGTKKQIIQIKQRALWAGSKKKVFKQYIVSLWSYIKYPFVRKKEDATREYFSQIYGGTIQDDLIFDGNRGGYYIKLESLQFPNKHYNAIFDCGCGIGSFFHFISRFQLISFDNYIGIDFALQDEKELTHNAKLIKDDINSYNFLSSGNGLIVLCNVACYLSGEKMKNIISEATLNNCDILVLDPLPGLFWDATFDKVKLHYRSFKKMNSLMATYNYTNTMVVKDYLWNIGKCYFTPLSYATLYTCKDFLLN